MFWRPCCPCSRLIFIALNLFFRQSSQESPFQPFLSRFSVVPFEVTHLCQGSVTITTVTTTDGATTTSRMNLSGYVGHATIFSRMFTIACCLVVGLGLTLGLGFALVTDR